MSACFLKYDAAYQVKRLPKVCMKCGRPSTEHIDIHLSAPRRGDGVLGLALDAAGVNEDVTAEVRAPICDRHPLMGLMIPIAICSLVACALLVGLTMLIFPTWVGLWFFNMSIALAIVLFFYTMFSDIHAGRVEGDGVHVWGVSSRFVAAYDEFLAGRDDRKAKQDRARLRAAQQTSPGEKPTLADDGTIQQPAANKPKLRRRKEKRIRFEHTQPKRREVMRTLGFLAAAWGVVFVIFTFSFPPWKSKSYRRAVARERKAAEQDRGKLADWFGGGRVPKPGANNDNGGGPPPAVPDANPPVAGPIESPTNMKGLIAYWALDEGEGERAANTSGSRQLATLRRAEWIEGRRGKAVSLAGQGCYVDLGAAAELNFAAAQPFTISGWGATKQPDGVLVSFRNSKNPASVVDVRIDRGKLVADVRGDRTEFGTASMKTVPFADGRWHHFALTRAPDGTITLFLDGKQVGRGKGHNSAGPITTDIRALGRERYWAEVKPYGNPHFTGSIDDVAVFNRDLTLKEIQRLSGAGG